MRRLIGALIGLTLGLVPWPASAQVIVHTVSITTDASGDATVYTQGTYGEVRAIRYVPDASTPLDSGADLTITDNGTGLQVITITDVGASARNFAPRMLTMTTIGAPALYAAGGTDVLDPIPVGGAIKVVVASGGNAKSGTLYIFVAGR